jgi:hypothetical protein
MLLDNASPKAAAHERAAKEAAKGEIFGAVIYALIQIGFFIGLLWGGILVRFLWMHS